MKKTIIIEVILLFVFSILFYFCFKYWDGVKNNIEHNILNSPYQDIVDSFYQTLTFAILLTLGLLATLAAIILIAVKDFPVFKPLLDKLQARKEARATNRAAKSEEAKQARIAKLEKELNRLKEDE